MARNTLESWIPEEDGSDVIQRVNQVSAVERLARRIPMGSDTRNEPRSAGVGVAAVAKGGTYTEDASVNDSVVLSAVKFGKAIRLAEEDLDDSLADVVGSKQKDWATSYAKFLDNACLGVTAAANGTTVPFTSVYKDLADNLAGNITSGAVDYDNLSAALGDLEAGDYFDETSVVVIANPGVRQAIRGIKDTQGMPIFVQGLAGTPDTIFGHAVVWSHGAKTSATATDSPSGNSLVVFANADYLMLGVRSGPESVFIDGRDGLSALTDESILKMRARRGFAVGKSDAFAVLEQTA